MSNAAFAAWAAAAFVLLPAFCYLCAKLGTWGFFRARYGFNEWKRRKEIELTRDEIGRMMNKVRDADSNSENN